MTEPTPVTRASKRAAKSAPAQSLRHARSGKRTKRMGWLGFIGIALAVVLVSGSSVAAIAVWDLTKSAKTVTLADKIPAMGAIEGGFNLMLVGSDTRDGQSNHYGANPGSTLNDVNILIHVSEDHQNVTAVSIPRDMVVPIAECEDGGGGWSGPINAVLNDGGLPCIVKTVSEMTGLEIPYAGLVTFDGVVALSNAVGGVRVCVNAPISDSHVNLNLSAGFHTLKGYDALKFLRTRHGVGDGSDLGRISNQQVFLSALMRKVKSDSVLTNPVVLYTMAKALVSNMTLSTSLNSPDVLVSMAMSLKDVNLNNIVFVQYPGTTGGQGIYAGKVQPDRAAADQLFEALRKDKPVVVTGGLGRGSTEGKAPKATASATPTPKASSSKTATPTPTPTASVKPVELDSSITGQSADQYTCSKAN
jgi:LCP family protein required for cell wall assembly